MVSIVEGEIDQVSAPQSIPGPRGLPLLGVMLDVKRDCLRYFVDLQRKYGDAVQYKVGFDRIMMVNNAKYIRHIFQENHKNYHKSKFYGPLRPILGDGIFLAEGQSWLNQRRTANKGFQGHCLKHMTKHMTDATADMLHRWEQYDDRNEAFDNVSEMMRLALDIVLRSLLSVRLEDQHTKIYDALTTVLREAERRVWSAFEFPKWMPTPGNLRLRNALNVLEEFVFQIIEERRNDQQQHSDLLSILLDAYGQRLAEGESKTLLRDQVLSIILAGHETTANSLSWTWYLLSRHPEVRDKLTQEVEQVLQGRVPTFQDLPQFVYMKQILDESLRLYPPVWSLSRVALEDDKIDDLEIPAGMNLMLCPYAVHRYSKYWPNPEGFDPERFAPGMERTRPQHAYIPFGGGPRTCLGSRFAIMEAQLIMAMVVQRFQLDLVPGQIVEPEPMITLRPRGEILVELRAAWRAIQCLRSLLSFSFIH